MTQKWEKLNVDCRITIVNWINYFFFLLTANIYLILLTKDIIKQKQKKIKIKQRINCIVVI